MAAFQWEMLLSPQPGAGHAALRCWGHRLSWQTNLFILDLFAACFYDILNSLNQNLRRAPVQGFGTFLLRHRTVMRIVARATGETEGVIPGKGV